MTDESAGWPPPTRPSAPVARAGELDTVWRSVLAACWVGVFFTFAAVWKASEEIGIATWWLGPRSEPQPLLIRLSPFALSLAIGLVVIYNRREAVWVSLGGAGVIAVLATLDLSRSKGLAVVEFAIAGAAALVTAASFSGRYRARPANTAPSTDPGDVPLVADPSVVDPSDDDPSDADRIDAPPVVPIQNTGAEPDAHG